jgi:hypothetical protein
MSVDEARCEELASAVKDRRLSRCPARRFRRDRRDPPVPHDDVTARGHVCSLEGDYGDVSNPQISGRHRRMTRSPTCDVTARFEQAHRRRRRHEGSDAHSQILLGLYHHRNPRRRAHTGDNAREGSRVPAERDRSPCAPERLPDRGIRIEEPLDDGVAGWSRVCLSRRMGVFRFWLTICHDDRPAS